MEPDPGHGRTRRHIAIVVPGFVGERDEPGMPAVVDLVERLAAIHDVEVVALRHPTARPPYRVAGVRVRALGLGTGGGAVARGRVLARGVRAVVTIHRRRPLDLVHGLWADEAGAVATLAGGFLRRPVVVSFMGGELTRLPDIGYGAALGRGGRWTVRIALRGADLVTAGSGLGRDAVLVHHPGAPVVLAPLGVDVARFRPADVAVGKATGAMAASTSRILFVGSLEPVKDPALAIRAFAALAGGRPALELELVGDGRLRPELEAQAARLGLGARIRFAGQLPRATLPDVYRAPTLLLVTSRHEGQSMVAVEAAASGLPVVGTRVGVLPDLGGGAATVESGDEEGLVSAVADVLDDPARAAAMGAAGRSVAVDQFDLDRTTADLLDRYEALITGR